MIESLVCPPPPTDNSINEDAISSLIVPAPGKRMHRTKSFKNPELISEFAFAAVKELHSPDGDSTTAPPSQSSEQSEVKNKVEFHLNPLPINNDSSPPQAPNVKKLKKVRKKPLSLKLNAERLRDWNWEKVPDLIAFYVLDWFQVLTELIETEQKYVKDLQFLLAAYLEPLKKEHFWNYADLEQLYKNVKEIFVFQTKFLRILEESLESDPGFCSHTSMAQFKVSLSTLCCCTLNNAILSSHF